jgi:DNA-binding transcriptional MocR family regulator
MHFAKLHSGARYNLAASGVANYPLSELPVQLSGFEINGPTIYGYAPLQQAIARKNQVPPECVVAAAGTSMANHLAMAATLEPEDEVLIESPTYELLVSLAKYLGAVGALLSTEVREWVPNRTGRSCPERDRTYQTRRDYQSSQSQWCFHRR